MKTRKNKKNFVLYKFRVFVIGFLIFLFYCSYWSYLLRQFDEFV